MGRIMYNIRQQMEDKENETNPICREVKDWAKAALGIVGSAGVGGSFSDRKSVV